MNKLEFFRQKKKIKKLNMSYNLAMSSKLVHSKKKKKKNNTKFLILAQCYLVTMLYTCGMELVSPIKKVGIQDNFEERE